MNPYLLTAAILPLLAAAVWQTQETWRHGSIFLSAREFVRSVLLPSRWAALQWLGKLLNCPFCLPHWIAGVYVAWTLAAIGFAWSWSTVGWWWITSLAVTRAAQVGNDVMKGTGWSQSPPSDVVLIDDSVTFSDGPDAQ